MSHQPDNATGIPLIAEVHPDHPWPSLDDKDPALYRLIPSDWEGTVTVQRTGVIVFHHPCHLDCPADTKLCMTCRTVWPCPIAQTVNAPQ